MLCYYMCDVMLCYITCVMLCYITCFMLLCYMTCVMLCYDMHHVMLYVTYVRTEQKMLYNMCHVMLYNKSLNIWQA